MCGRVCVNQPWLTDLFFLIFVRGHIQLAPYPPVAHARPLRWAALAHMGDASVMTCEVFKDHRMHSTQEKISSMNSMTYKILNTDSKSVLKVKKCR